MRRTCPVVIALACASCDRPPRGPDSAALAPPEDAPRERLPRSEITKDWLVEMSLRRVEFIRRAQQEVLETGMLVKPVECPPSEACARVDEQRIACAAGDGDACGDLAQAYYLGAVVAKDWERARRYAAVGCGDGSDFACMAMATLIEFTDVIEEWGMALSVYWTTCFDADELDLAWACFGAARSITVHKRGVFAHELALDALEHGCARFPDHELTCPVLECLRADPERNAFECAK